MNAKELSAMIGREGSLIFGKLTIRITILNAREKFGRVDLLVAPKRGSGSEWKSLNDSIILDR